MEISTAKPTPRGEGGSLTHVKQLRSLPFYFLSIIHSFSYINFYKSPGFAVQLLINKTVYMLPYHNVQFVYSCLLFVPRKLRNLIYKIIYMLSYHNAQISLTGRKENYWLIYHISSARNVCIYLLYWIIYYSSDVHLPFNVLQVVYHFFDYSSIQDVVFMLSLMYRHRGCFVWCENLGKLCVVFPVENTHRFRGSEQDQVVLFYQVFE